MEGNCHIPMPPMMFAKAQSLRNGVHSAGAAHPAGCTVMHGDGMVPSCQKVFLIYQGRSVFFHVAPKTA